LPTGPIASHEFQFNIFEIEFHVTSTPVAS
jgi:hypothetical protein